MPRSAVWALIVLGTCGSAEGLRASPPGSHTAPEVVGPGAGIGTDPFLARLAIDPESPEARAYAAACKRRISVERELKIIRAKHFGTMQNVEIRQAGIGRLRTFTDPSVYAALLEVFEHEEEDVRTAVLDHLRDQRRDEADAALAWAAVHDRDRVFRAAAGRRLVERAEERGESGRVCGRVKTIIAAGLRGRKERSIAAAAHLAQTLRLFEAIPMLINAQVGGGDSAAGGDGEGDGALAYILVGTQQAFVADLTPVVGDSAVAFDPELGVITEGTYVRVIDAYVITYRVDVHNALTALADAGWDGRSTKALGWDGAAWRTWYTDEFKPYRARVDAAASGVPPTGG